MAASFEAFEESAGWIKLASAYLQESTWFFNFDAPNRSAVAGSLLLRNGLSIYTPGQMITDTWAIFGDQRFMPEWWDWANGFLHVILTDAYSCPDVGETPHVWTPRINEFVDLNVAEGTEVTVGNLRYDENPTNYATIIVKYADAYLYIKRADGLDCVAKGIIHYCGTAADTGAVSP